MSMRSVGITHLLRRDPAAGLAYVRRALFINGGEMKKTARYLGVSRRTIFRLVHRLHLWRYVWSFRRRAAELSRVR